MSHMANLRIFHFSEPARAIAPLLCSCATGHILPWVFDRRYTIYTDVGRDFVLQSLIAVLGKGSKGRAGEGAFPFPWKFLNIKVPSDAIWCNIQHYLNSTFLFLFRFYVRRPKSKTKSLSFFLL